MIKTQIMIQPFPSTRKDRGYYAYVHYDNWTKQVTCEGVSKEIAYRKAVDYCLKHNINLETKEYSYDK